MSNTTENIMFATYLDVVGVAELQEMIGVGRTLAYQLVKTGKIHSIKIGRKYKITKTAVIEYLTQK